MLSSSYKSQVLTYEGMVYEWNTHVQQQHSVPSAYACLVAAVFRSSRSSSVSFLQNSSQLLFMQWYTGCALHWDRRLNAILQHRERTQPPTLFR